MSGTYQRPPMTAPEVTAKPSAGEAWLKSKEAKAERKNHERKEMDKAKVRDERKCRVPRCEHMPKKPRIDAAHLKEEHRGMGGNPAMDRTERKKLLTMCFIHHDLYDDGDLIVEPLTDAIFDGPCAYYDRMPDGSKRHIGTEKVVGVSTAVGQ